MKLWDKGRQTSQSVERFTVGRDREFDQLLALYDVAGSIAHAIMVAEQGIISDSESEQLVSALRDIAQDIESEQFRIPESAEDVHSYVEALLTQRIGESGKKIHTGRSRNDQVLVDLKMWMRTQLAQLQAQVVEVFELLMSMAERYRDVPLAGYTHFQVAMPSSFGLWFGAWAESLVDDMELLSAAYRVVNKNPLGSAAGYGSTFALNRQRTTELLGFELMNVSSVYAQMTRGKSERVCAQSIAAIASTIGRMAMDVCLYCSQNFGFLKLPAEYTTGSSLMPHKNNPDVFELIRAKCNRLQALPNDIMMVMTNLPSGYHRDVQILKELIMPAFDELQSCLSMVLQIVPVLEPRADAMKGEVYRYLYSVDAVHALVQQGLSFRDAYRKIAESIVNDEYQEQAPDPQNTVGSHEGSIAQPGFELIREQMEQATKRVPWKDAERALGSLLKKHS